MSCWAILMCSSSCHGEYGRPAGCFPCSEAGSPATAASNPTWASLESRSFASCSRIVVGSAVTMHDPILADCITHQLVGSFVIADETCYNLPLKRHGGGLIDVPHRSAFHLKYEQRQ